MYKLLGLGLLVMSLNTSASMITCYINTPSQFSIQGEVVMAADGVYRVQGEDMSIRYLPANQCVVDGIILTPRYMVCQ